MLLLYKDTISLRCIQEPTFEHVTLKAAKNHARVDLDDDDPLIRQMITAARKSAEGKLHRVLCESTWEWTLSGARQEVHEIPVSPCFSCVGVKMNEATVNDDLYSFVPSGEGGVSSPLYALLTLNGVLIGGDAVKITVKAGYPKGGCPKDIYQWMLVKISSLYDQREAFASGANTHEFGRNFVDCLLDQYILP